MNQPMNKIHRMEVILKIPAYVNGEYRKNISVNLPLSHWKKVMRLAKIGEKTIKNKNLQNTTKP